MKMVVLLAGLLAFSPSSFAAHELGSGNQPAAYECDDGIADGGLRVRFSLSKEGDQMTAHVYAKSKKDPQLVAKGSLVATVGNGIQQAYENGETDSYLSITVSARDENGLRTLLGTYSINGACVRFPDSGVMTCYQEGPGRN